ncbi:MAG: exodeoxyribonuclease VII small subunit [Actinomycetia bacterium]|nr:exodeoxyribonuclease VII small subunit [Actinomycetes bacterium]MCP4959887.1 exodeoxyribonuclease VII small subunit [Actinomycetes bacterium]
MTDRDDSDVSYAEAVQELETIISALEGDQLDIDGLAERVARAANLIEVCRSRIERARVEVDKVVSGLEAQG